MSEIIKKIAEATLSVGAFAADKRNREQNYDYISADMVLEKAGQAMARAGFSVVPSVTKWDIATVERVGKNPRLDAVVSFEMHVTDGVDDLVMPWLGMGSDYAAPDKAIYKAITSGHKYFLMKLLNISIGNEDSEHENTPAPVMVQKAEPEKAPTMPRTAEMIQAGIQMVASREKPNTVMSAEKTAALDGLLESLFMEVIADDRRELAAVLIEYIFGKRVTRDLSHAQKIALWKWMEPAELGGVWTASEKAQREAAIIIAAVDAATGQKGE